MVYKPCPLLSADNIWTQEQELCFISGEFLDYEIPRQDQWLAKYYKRPDQLSFLRYYLKFENRIYVKEHTGLNYNRRWPERMTRKLKLLRKIYEEAMESGNMELVAELKSGQYKFDFRI